MKRLFLIILICTSGILFSQEYFRSNTLGMPLEKIDPLRREEYPYILFREDGEVEKQILFHNGEEVKTWIITRIGNEKRVMEYEKGEISLQTFYRHSLIREMFFFQNGSLHQSQKYLYTQRKLNSIKTFDGDENLLFKDSFLRDRRGYLRHVIRSYPGGEKRIVSFQLSSGNLTQESISEGDAMTILHYNDEGLHSREQWTGEQLFLKEEFFSEGGETCSREVNNETGGVILRKYDDKGNLIYQAPETGYPKEFFGWDDGKINNKTIITRGLRKEWSYDYEEGAISRETYRENGEILRLTEYFDDGKSISILYSEGKPTFRITYFDGVKTGHEVLGE
ncbi:MAG: hypothetical protein KAU17_02235 [Spirochaetales bacterium]|nr:hypothetical protein [Spirochaetales bacterium]